MPKKEKTNSEKKNFNEFSYEGKSFTYSGRVYSKQEGKGKVNFKAYVQLILNGVITIKGCYLVDTDNNVFLTYPEYKDKEGKTASYFYLDKDFRESKEYEELVNIIASKAK